MEPMAEAAAGDKGGMDEARRVVHQDVEDRIAGSLTSSSTSVCCPPRGPTGIRGSARNGARGQFFLDKEFGFGAGIANRGLRRYGVLPPPPPHPMDSLTSDLA
jgi:hypothetical protein